MAYFIGRLARSLLVLVGVSVTVFVITHLIGDPAKLILPLDASREQYLLARQQMGLDRPLYIQFAEYASGVLRGDFGDSLWQRQPALPLAVSRLWATLQLGVAAMGLALAFGVPAGLLAANKPNSRLDRVITIVSLFGISVANFWLSLMLILIFAVKLHLFPTSGYGTWNHFILPMLAASAWPFGRIAQIARASMIEELHQPYMVVATAKGLSNAYIAIHHALRNAALPIITMAGYDLGRIVAGFIVIIEVIFGWPGLGQLTFESLSRHDFPLIQACIMVISVSVVLINTLVDLSYSVVDPRIRLA